MSFDDFVRDSWSVEVPSNIIIPVTLYVAAISRHYSSNIAKTKYELCGKFGLLYDVYRHTGSIKFRVRGDKCGEAEKDSNIMLDITLGAVSTTVEKKPCPAR